MNKWFNKSFVLGIIAGAIITTASLYILFLFDDKYHFLVKPIVEEVLEVDSCIIDYNDSYYDSEEFTMEMMKGVQGDFTLEQVDSMQRSWAEQDSIEKVSH